MYFEKSFAIFMGAFVVWGFLMAMFFNLMLIGFKAKRDMKLLFVSVVMFLSYFASDYFYDVFAGHEIYKTWFLYDMATLLLLTPIFFVTKSRVSPGVVYVFIGLTVNSLLFLLMHIDRVVVGNENPWWYWSLYSIGVNTADLLMIVVLIVDRDVLGFIRLGNYLKRNIVKFIKRTEAHNFTILNA
ncbi:hypothetical protein [Pseudoalteromonas sp. GB56]